MGKKGKVNKLARMSDEERARYLQHRADMEEEARRRKRELIARFIKNKLDKEETYSRMNTAKLNQGWRYILRKIKCKQMTQDIQGMMTTFNFMVVRKDRLIEALMKAIEDADDQHRRAFQTHTETLSYFLGIGCQRLNKLQAEYDFQKNSLLENWDKEEVYITNSQQKAEFKLKLILYIQDRDFKRYKNLTQTARATAFNDSRLEHEEQMRDFCRPKQSEVEHYWSQLREIYDSYQEKHNPIMGHYHTLMEKDEFYQREIARNELHIQQASELLANLQKECINTSVLMTSKVQRMNSRKEKLAKRYWAMKREVKLQRSKESERLEIMVNVSQDAIKRLEDLRAKFDKINQLYEICCKYETACDNIVSRENENGDNVEHAELYENLDEAMIYECKEYNKMSKFMLKMNRVQIQTLCLKTEKAKLVKENIQIKQYVKRYLTEMALKGGKDRPLSVQLQSSMQKIDAKEKVLRRPVTCIEGALSIAVMHEKRSKHIEQRNRDIGKVISFPRVQCWM